MIFILVFGLTKSFVRDESTISESRNMVTNEKKNASSDHTKENPFLSLSNIAFVVLYILTLIVVGFISNFNPELFVPWNHFTPIQVIQTAASILLCFFLPGYAVVSIVSNSKRFKPVPKILLAYVFSLAITGLAGFLAAVIGFPISEIKPELTAVYIAILTIFIGISWIKARSHGGTADFTDTNYRRLKITLRKNSIALLVFGTLFALVVLSTYYLYQGIIIGDEWFHHGRALSLLAGAFESEAADTLYPAFFHGLLAAFFSISGVPSVNAYTSINFLNIIPVLAFYYLFRNWISNPKWQRSALLACTFFMISSGFGWINVLTMSVSTIPVKSQLSALEVFHLVETKTLDIRRAGSFVITASPQPTTGLLLVGLPAGFLLLGLIRENQKVKRKLNCGLKYVAILTTISTVGILSHDEFYLFVIIASLLPLIFRSPESKNSVYIALLSSLFIVILADITSPVQYYTTRQILGVPLVVLNVLFVAFMWSLYASQIFHRIHFPANTSIRKIFSSYRLKVLLGVVIAATVAYLYLFTFLVWGQLSGEEVQSHQLPYDFPWYLYPMKLGVTGLLGFAFVLSYFFKKFEKEVFIFGIIAITALLLGPYYDEYRFSKYIMVGIGAFASLLVSKIVMSIKGSRVRPLLTGIIIGVVVTSSSLSVLMFNGYTASAVQNPDFEQFHTHLHRRIFPSPQEISFLNYLHNDLINLKTDYITVPGEYGGPESKLEVFDDQELENKIQGFVGPSVASAPKFLQSPFTTNASSLGGFYDLLNYTNTRYIVIPNENIIDNKMEEPIRFALQNFQKPYQANNNTILRVPPLAPQSSSGEDVALIYQPDGMLLSASVPGQKVLQFNNESFKGITNSSFVKTENQSNKQHDAILYSGNISRTLWSNSMSQKDGINYIQARFKIIDRSDDANASSGIVMQDQNKVYYVSLSDKGLKLSAKANQTTIPQQQVQIQLSKNEGIKKQDGIWYTLKLARLGNTLRIYLDDLLKLQVRTDPSQRINISKVGIRSDEKIIEFAPLVVGHISESDKAYYKETYYRIYYPLSALALSKSAYRTFVAGDLSAFSDKNVILTWDPADSESNFRDYLEFAKSGGTLIVISPDSEFVGGFSKLLSIKGGNETRFDSILQSNAKQQPALRISGFTKTIGSKSVNATIKSYYMNNNQQVAPFALEKKYGSSGGKIIFVNSAGYFDAIFNSPETLFSTLAYIPTELGFEGSKYIKENPVKGATPGVRFIGDLTISGHATINSSSLLLPHNGTNNFNAEHISLSNRHPNLMNFRYLNNLRNVVIKDLMLSGSYKVIIESRGTTSLPSSTSQYDYLGLSLPNRFDMTVELLGRSGAAAEFIFSNSTENSDNDKSVKITNPVQIQFHNISNPESSNNNQTFIVLMKRPEINGTGKITVNNLFTPNGPQGTYGSRGSYDLNLQGNIVMRVDHVDNYVLNYHNASTIQYVTYLKWMKSSGDTVNDKSSAIKIPGDISESAKRKGIGVPWEEVMASTNSIVLLISIIFIAALFSWRLWPRIMKLDRTS